MRTITMSTFLLSMCIYIWHEIGLNGRHSWMKPFTSTALKVDQKGLWILDQPQLPGKEEWLWSPTPASMIQIIKQLKVRGAPLIGVAAALQLALFVEQGASDEAFGKALQDLREARPTAVNL